MYLREWVPVIPNGHGRWERGREADLDRLFALDQSCFQPGIAYTREDLRAFLAHPSAFSVLLEGSPDPHAGTGERGELLGFSIARPIRRHCIPMLHIITIDVAPAARRSGAGSLLMGWMMDKARALQAQAIRLEVAVDNHVALGFYSKLGFREMSRIPGYYLGTIDALVLERKLTA